MASTPSDDPRPSLDGLPVRVVDPTDLWPSLCIGRSVPLGRLEFLWTLRGSAVRDSSTTAKATFSVASTSLPHVPASPQLAHKWFSRPYLHILLVSLPPSDASNDTWSRVRDFVDASRDHGREYLVIAVADENAARAQRKVLEKLRSEVNGTTRGRERIVVVPPAAPTEGGAENKPISQLHHSPAHQDLLVRLRECARDGVENRIQAYGTESGRAYAGRAATGWSFSAFFSMKEGMSFVFVQIGRRDLALKCYDELDNVMAEREERGDLGFCGANEGADGAIGVVDSFAKEVRKKIIQNEVTELDFRTYLFARQISLLLVDRKYSEVAERGLKFITVIARRAAEEALSDASAISPLFRDAWVFSAARSLAAALAPAIPSTSAAQNAVSKQLGTARERHTARLIAGFHVHALKAFTGLAKLALPGTLISASNSASGPATLPLSPEIKQLLGNLSNEMLRVALSEPANAVELHSEMANAAASLYEMGGRARGAAALDGDAGVVRLRNDSLVEAEELLSAQCSRFTEDHGWDQLHRRRRVELATAEKNLSRIQEYLVSCLTMLFMTRRRRQLGFSAGARTSDDSLESEAVRWAGEAQRAASQLPRVMKYKAEKLVQLYVRNSDGLWHEGDAGSATVVIDSDLPASLDIDSVHVELRWSPLEPGVEKGVKRPSPLNSALRSVDGGSDKAGLAPPSSALSGSVTVSDTLVLSWEKTVKITPGLTSVQVSTSEVPRPGLYTVTHVSLVLGRLKLVQTACKLPTVPTVTTKGATSAKVPSAALAASAAQAGLPGSNQVRFPCFFATTRPRPAIVEVTSVSRLFLAPCVQQFVSILISAGPSGVAARATIRLTLSSAGDSSLGQDGKSYVELVDSSDVEVGASDGKSALPVKLTENSVSSGEVVLSESIPSSGTFQGLVALRVVENLSACLERDGAPASCDLQGRSAVLHVSVVCAELTTSRTKTFACNAVHRLALVTPLQVTARLELNGCADELSASTQAAGGAEFDAPLGGGGLLLCSLRSRAGSGKYVTVKSASVKLPPWLVLVENGMLSHSDLFPSKLGNNGLFSVAFDTNIRGQAVERIAASLAGMSIEDHVPVARKGTRSRAVLAELESHDEDLTERTEEELMGAEGEEARDYEMLSGQDLEATMQKRRTNRSGSMSGKDSHSAVAESGTNKPLEQLDVLEDSAEEDGHHNVDDRGEVDGLNGRRGEHSRPMHRENQHLRESGEEVVDLSDSSFRPYRDAHSPSASLPGGMDAVLQVELEIEGMQGTSLLEYAVSVSGFRPHRKRFRIERSSALSASVGEPVTFKFQVSAIAGPILYEDAPEATVLHYEVDANSQEWIVAGRRRGQVIISSSEGDTATVTIISLLPGRLYLPFIKLYEHDGCPLSSNRYENLNRGSQVTVLPSTRVISACSSTPLPKSNINSLARGGAMRHSALLRRPPTVSVVDADKFFFS